MIRGGDRQTIWNDALVACTLAALMIAVWTLQDWHRLAALRLPDTDDAMRLVQIRDWLAGQRFADLVQHRLADGLPMHWSRLPDLVPGAMIAALTPIVGRNAAELTAVIVWPGLLFTTALFLVARIARIFDPHAASLAALVASLAYPATTVFLPGRIDHHGLQVVLLLALVLALMRPATFRRGIAAGLGTVASVVIGLETLPLIAAAGLAMAVEWVMARPGTGERLTGFGIAMIVGLLAARLIFGSAQWGYPACDGFTDVFWRAAMIVAGVPLLLVALGRHVAQPPIRFALGLGIGMTAMIVAIVAAPQCLRPYGAVDPLLAGLWLGRVGEAQPLFEAPWGTALGYAGVMLAGIVANGWHWFATRNARWMILFAVQLAALVLTGWQLRGAYAGAMLAAPALAVMIVAARRRGTASLIGAWLVSAGMLYPIAARAVVPDHPAVRPIAGDCTSPASLAALAALPRGTILAPLDLGPYALAGTPHTVVAAPYHRNNAGNLASYRFFLAPAGVRNIARRWHADYVVLCDASFAELPQDPPLAARLRAGEPPAWLKPVAIDAPGLKIWRVR